MKKYVAIVHEKGQYDDNVKFVSAYALELSRVYTGTNPDNNKNYMEV